MSNVVVFFEDDGIDSTTYPETAVYVDYNGNLVVHSFGEPDKLVACYVKGFWRAFECQTAPVSEETAPLKG